MKTVQMISNQGLGGADKACLRLHEALVEYGVRDLLLCRTAERPAPGVEACPMPGGGSFLWSRRGQGGQPYCLPVHGGRLDLHPSVQTADVLNLHWVAEMLSTRQVRRLGSLGKPLVWTLHDMWPMTGGCHYAGDCTGYLGSCRDCPALEPELAPLAAWALAQRMALWEGLPLTIVCPSRWLAEKAKASPVLGRFPVEVIANSVNPAVFAPVPKAKARSILGLPRRARIVAFSAYNLGDARKGLSLLQQALASLPPAIGKDILLLGLGQLDWEPVGSAAPLMVMGRVADEARLALLLAAADLSVVPSIEDNLPNTVLESLSCGTPVVGFATGGIPEMLDAATGILSPPDAQGLAWAMESALQRDWGGPETVSRAVQGRFSPELQARRYHELYSRLLAERVEGGILPEPEPDALEGMALQAQAEYECRRGLEDFQRAQAYRLRDLGLADEAVESLRRGLGGEHPAQAERQLAGLVAGAGRPEAALERFQDLLLRYPWRADVGINLADAYRYAGRHAEGLAVLGGLEKAFPRCRGLDAARAALSLKAGHWSRAARAALREWRLHGDGQWLLRVAGELKNCPEKRHSLRLGRAMARQGQTLATKGSDA